GGRAPHVDMAAFGGMLPSWPHFPGAGQVGYRQFSGEGERPGVGLWQLVERTVRSRGIPARFDCAVVDLVVDDGVVRGAVLQDGTEIEATGGVVLASGGIEYDAE